MEWAVTDLGRMAYHPGWEHQRQVHERVVAGTSGPQLLLVEHPPTITFGRRDGTPALLKLSPQELQDRGFELVHSDRGGQTTYHGPGQLVAYPIVRLADLGVSVSGYVHGLEAVIVQTLARFGVTAQTDPKAVGVWVTGRAGLPEKIAAVGVRVRDGATLHGLALNVCPDLTHFDAIVPCGIADRAVTSLHKLLGDTRPSMAEVSRVLVAAVEEQSRSGWAERSGPKER